MNLTSASCEVTAIKHHEVIPSPNSVLLPLTIKFSVLLTMVSLRLFERVPTEDMFHSFDTEAASSLVVMLEEHDPQKEGAQLAQQKFSGLFGPLVVDLKSPHGQLEFEGRPKGQVTCSPKLGGVGIVFNLEAKLTKEEMGELGACFGSILFSAEPLVLLPTRRMTLPGMDDELH